MGEHIFRTERNILQSLINAAIGKTNNSKSLVEEDDYKGLTDTIAIDCEMVGAKRAKNGQILARASIVNEYGQCVYDEFVKPTKEVTDYRTSVSGVRPEDLLEKGVNFKKVQEEIAAIKNGRILVGHTIHNDLNVLFKE